MVAPTRTKLPPPKVPGARVLIIESPYYADIAALLVEGAIAEIEAAGAEYERVQVAGALEIAQALAIHAESLEFDFEGAVALGCVIRGETSHYDIVCENANRNLYEVALDFSVPVGNGILTVDDEAQAIARAKGGREGKGGDAARACLGLIALRRKIEEEA
jgi:6,7-dimethyl-8-ribityllumazine synthase